MAVRLFISYSHRDERFLRSLEPHLSILKRNGLIEVWHDREIRAGSLLDDEIDARLDNAEVVILLVSPDFVASDYCFTTEMRRALERHKEGVLLVIPVILRPVDWHETPLSGLKALPKDGKPISTWKNRDEAYLDVERGLKGAIQQIGSGKMIGNVEASPTFPAYAFQGSVVQVGGIGSRLTTKTVWLTTEHGYLDANQFLTIWFNGAGDVMWVACPEDYRIIGATSPTGNSVFPMNDGVPDTPFGLLITDKVQNTIIVTCEAKPDEIERPRATGWGCQSCNERMAPYQRYCAKCGWSLQGTSPGTH